MSTLTVSPNFNDRPLAIPIDMLVLHYTGMQTCQVALERLCDGDAQVSAHYLIDEDGTVYRLVDEDKRAWHAGVAWWRGAMDVNGRSVGIELVNPGHEFGYRAFPEAQMTALEALAGAILKRHPIPPHNVVGHSDVAPRRKQDPGELFDWQRLAAHGIGLWVDDAQPTKATNVDVAIMLAAFGYDITDLGAALAAFQRHFRPALVSGEADPETVGILKALLEMA
ncbi:N-acetylmuramoyl-L-alanine amidase [Magnetovibrio sp.]|uniref:N-acetylmuramoyl-L-alanine amidase n=1 Tax=Magnetovibrio sp. TaxID=2024836 RepID=UPI002F93D87F